MPVEFTVRPSDLRQATRELKVNRGKEGQEDFVDILVSQFVATFRAVGTETEIPVDGKQPGTVRLPLRCVEAIKKILPSFKKKELTFSSEPGVVKIGTWSLKHPDIELGNIPDQRIAIPVDVSVLDTLALARLLGPDRVASEGMRPRVEAAMQASRHAIDAAVEALQPLGIGEDRIQDLVESHIVEASERLRRTLGLS
ncbi:MAG TPA: hypothetical protein VM715_12275 [Candidatus Acidoferrum sp.]|jgi:hypothetical protein|nr:hypothetical protein [Candidatus Acidoferrum sp.]